MSLKIFVFSSLVALVLGAAVNEQVPIVSQDFDISPDGTFKWSYQSGDGSAQEQSGKLVGAGEDFGEAVQGSAQWTDPEGGQHQLRYTADTEGYKPEGADIPVAPPIPAAILRSLEYIATHA